MLPNSTPEKDSGANVAVSDPFALNGASLYMSSHPTDQTSVSKAAVNGNNKQVKKTFGYANISRKAANQSNMPPPMSTGTSLSNDPSSHTFKDTSASHVSRYFPSFSNAQLVSVSSDSSSFDDMDPDPLARFKAQAKPGSNKVDKLEGHAPTEALPPKTHIHSQDIPNARMKEDVTDPRPTKRRRVLSEQDQNTLVPQNAGDRRESMPTSGSDNAHYATEMHEKRKDTVAETSNVPHESSSMVKLLPTTAFQNYAKENADLLQSRKAHWSTCSMDAWLAGGQEIADRFSELLTKGIEVFESDMEGFTGIEKSMEDYKNDVLDNRDQVLRQAKAIMVAASSGVSPQ